MNEQQMRAECAKIAAEWQAGGLAGASIYEDFAVELAKRVQAAERERCLGVLADTQMTAGLGKAAVDPGTAEAYYDHDTLDAIIDCLSECMDQIAGPNGMVSAHAAPT